MICLFDPHSRSKGLAAVRGWKLEKKKMKMMDVVGIRVLTFKSIFVMKKTMEEEKREIFLCGFLEFCFVEIVEDLGFSFGWGKNSARLNI